MIYKKETYVFKSHISKSSQIFKFQVLRHETDAWRSSYLENIVYYLACMVHMWYDINSRFTIIPQNSFSKLLYNCSIFLPILFLSGKCQAGCVLFAIFNLQSKCNILVSYRLVNQLLLLCLFEKYVEDISCEVTCNVE
jgi:hypothetical protein